MKDVLKREYLPIGALVPHSQNPNKMKPREFDLLVENMQTTGFVDPIFVRDNGDGTYGIIGGHHRWDAAKYLDFTEVPCTIAPKGLLDDDMVDFQLLRMNVIKGALDPNAFFALYQKHEAKYGADLLQEMFGFADDKEWERLVTATAKQLPKELQSKFKEAAAEIKTIDGLSKLLNHMFTNFGDTLPYGFMVVDYGGQASIWLRIEKKTYDATLLLADVCMSKKVTMDDLVGGIVQLIAKGEASDLLEKVLSKTKTVEVPSGFAALPTADNLEKVSKL